MLVETPDAPPTLSRPAGEGVFSRDAGVDRSVIGARRTPSLSPLAGRGKGEERYFNEQEPARTTPCSNT
jgi:hypothetical protein